jgi:hypothetical protein
MPVPQDRYRGLRSVQARAIGESRPKGARNKLAEEFLAELLANYEQHGPPDFAGLSGYPSIAAASINAGIDVMRNGVVEYQGGHAHCRAFASA